MKKETQKKLTLQRETLRTLSTTQLDEVAGGSNSLLVPVILHVVGVIKGVVAG